MCLCVYMCACVYTCVSVFMAVCGYMHLDMETRIRQGLLVSFVLHLNF